MTRALAARHTPSTTSPSTFIRISPSSARMLHQVVAQRISIRLLRLASIGQHQLVRLLRRGVLRRAGVPRRNRRLTGRIQRFHRLPHCVDAIGEEIADQEIRDGALQTGIVADEVAEAEAVVVLAHETPHAIDTLVEHGSPLAELRGRGVVLRKALDDGVGGHLAGPQREQHAGRVERIEEAPRVANHHPAVAGHFRRAIRIIFRREVAGDSRRGCDALLDGGAAVHFFPIRLLVTGAILEQVIERRHDADRHDVVVQGDVPEPAVALRIRGPLPPGPRRLQHHGRAFVAAGVAIRAFPVRPDGALVQHRIPDTQAETILNQPGLPAGVDDDLGADVTAPAAVLLNRDTDRTAGAERSRRVVLEDDINDADAFVDRDAMLARVVEHHFVELAAHHLPGLRTLVRLVVPEVERRRQLAARVDELHAVLLDETALLHFRQHVQPPQHPVGFGNQRFADVKARKLLALEELDAHALLRQQRRTRRSRGTATDHNDISHLFSLALGPHPQRELTLTPRLGFPRPRLGAPPQRGCRAGGPGVAAGAFHWRWGHTPSFITAINDFPPVDALFWIRPSAAPAARASGGGPREPKKSPQGVPAPGGGPPL